MSIRFGIVSPIVTLLPKGHGHWEREAGIEELARVAEVADRAGVDYLTCSEHVAVPADVAQVRGATYWDPAATLGFLAARTTRIRLATSVVVLGYHHPLALAKTYGTLDRISNGRVVLGVGVGSLREEFELLGAPFDDRGERADDAMRALRAGLSRPDPSYDGPHYRYGGVVVEPYAVQGHVPLWVGGRTRRSLRRAVELADGWMPFGLTVEQMRSWLAAVDLPAGFELALSPERALDPGADRGRVAEVLGLLAEAGTTVVNARVVGHSLEHYLEQVEALAEVAA